MKNLIGIILLILALFLIFNMTEIAVTDTNTGEPVSFAKIGYFYTDESGKAIFLGTILKNNLNVSRIGYKDKTINLPLAFLKRTREINLDVNDYQGLISQFSQWSENLSRYKYTFSTNLIQNSKTEKVQFIARKIGRNFSFEMRNEGESGKTTKIVNIGDNMYTSVDSGPLKGPLSEEDKQKFMSENIVFLSLSDIILDSFPVEVPQEIKFEGNTISILWNSSNILNAFLDKNGNISEMDFFEFGSDRSFKSILKIDTINIEKIEVNESR